MTPFDPLMFPDSVTFHPAGSSPEARGDVRLSASASGGTTLPAYVEPVTTGLTPLETHHVEEGSQVYAVFTATDPGAAPSSLVGWNGLTMRALGRSVRGFASLYRTGCLDVS